MMMMYHTLFIENTHRKSVKEQKEKNTFCLCLRHNIPMEKMVHISSVTSLLIPNPARKLHKF